MKWTGLVPLALALASPALAQTICGPTPSYSPCEIGFELPPTDLASHPNPYRTIELRAEFRSPRHKTYMMPAYWDGGGRMVIRFSPNEPGDWDFRVSGNVSAFEGKQGKFSATASESRGFIRAANVHHFAYAGNDPHLWMCDTVPLSLDRAAFEARVNARVAQKFTHLRVRLTDWAKVFSAPDRPDPAYFKMLDERLLFINGKGITIDLVLAGGNNELTKVFPEREQRERFVRYLVSRYTALAITWQPLDAFETYDNGRELLQEIAGVLKAADPYQHIRSAGALVTSGPLLDDGWMSYLSYRTEDDQVRAIEHQIYAAPGVSEFSATTTDEFRKRLWNATMNGQYPAPDIPSEDAAKQMAVWFDFFSGTRHWELEPYFDVEGGRALALEDVEYIVYVEKPGPVTVHMEKSKYDVAWINPANGERVDLKDIKGDEFTGEPPDRAHDWVLHLSREGHKASMLKSFKFESKYVVTQEIESNPQKLPFDIEQPSSETLSMSKPATYSAKLKKETRATKAMQYLWTGEVTADGKSYRVLGTGREGTLHIPKDLARRFPALLHLRVTAMNGYGKLYVADRNYTLTP